MINTNSKKNIKKIFSESINLKSVFIEANINVLNEMVKIIYNCVCSGNKVMLCGNGGSASDAQHLAAEMLVRLRPMNNRESLPFISLTMDNSTLTACGNDYGYDMIFERALEGIGKKNDCLIGISTSGNSQNIINAMKMAKQKSIKVLGFLGSGGGKAKQFCDLSMIVPSYVTGRIQEVHITAGHAILEAVEDKLIQNHKINVKE